MLKNQMDRDAIPRYLGNLEVANKTGALDQVRNDVGIVYAKNGPIIISAFTYDNADQSWTPDNTAQSAYRKFSKNDRRPLEVAAQNVRKSNGNATRTPYCRRALRCAAIICPRLGRPCGSSLALRSNCQRKA